MSDDRFNIPNPVPSFGDGSRFFFQFRLEVLFAPFDFCFGPIQKGRHRFDRFTDFGRRSGYAVFQQGATYTFKLAEITVDGQTNLENAQTAFQFRAIRIGTVVIRFFGLSKLPKLFFSRVFVPGVQRRPAIVHGPFASCFANPGLAFCVFLAVGGKIHLGKNLDGGLPVQISDGFVKPFLERSEFGNPVGCRFVPPILGNAKRLGRKRIETGFFDNGVHLVEHFFGGRNVRLGRRGDEFEQASAQLALRNETPPGPGDVLRDEIDRFFPDCRRNRSSLRFEKRFGFSQPFDRRFVPAERGRVAGFQRFFRPDGFHEPKFRVPQGAESRFQAEQLVGARPADTDEKIDESRGFDGAVGPRNFLTVFVFGHDGVVHRRNGDGLGPAVDVVGLQFMDVGPQESAGPAGLLDGRLERRVAGLRENENEPLLGKFRIVEEGRKQLSRCEKAVLESLAGRVKRFRLSLLRLADFLVGVWLF